MLETLLINGQRIYKRERKKTETLLSNVLPKITADEIMAKGKATKIKYNLSQFCFLTSRVYQNC